ncbi:PDGLE domain-containing protein [Nocardioides sp.]|uniref:PDGLE domain-containing protein n=1 Tax=Nocardioides sp. TaxID=35761 RepID=UPI00239FB606|nr:PDGLE domain-containing protein [Nocardioides sp.]MDE0775251.1 PDGLE domain-containing protein [Nocardioides sp.]
MRQVSTRLVAGGILLVALLLAGVVSFYASSSPDGLESVADEKGFIDTAGDHATGDGPLADYDAGLDSDRASVGVAGVVGVLVVLGLGTGLTYVVRRRTPDTQVERDSASTSA